MEYHTYWHWNIIRMNKSRIIYITGLLIALGVLIWDKTANRNSVSSPQTAGAYPVESQRIETSSGDTKTTSHSLWENIEELPDIPQNWLKSETPFLARTMRNITQKIIIPTWEQVSASSENALTRDLFMATEEFTTALNRPENGARMKQANDQNHIDHARNAKTLQLSGILIGTHDAYAVIDREVMHQGEHIGPYHIGKIESDFVVLSIEEQQIPLYLDK